MFAKQTTIPRLSLKLSKKICVVCLPAFTDTAKFLRKKKKYILAFTICIAGADEWQQKKEKKEVKFT